MPKTCHQKLSHQPPNQQVEVRWRDAIEASGFGSVFGRNVRTAENAFTASGQPLLALCPILKDRKSVWVARLDLSSRLVIGLVMRTVAPKSEKDASQFSRNRDGCDEFASSQLDLRCPERNRVVWTSSPKAPGRLCESSTNRCRTGLGDAQALLSGRAGMLTRCQTKKALNGMCTRETADLINGSDETHARHWADPGHRHQSSTHRIFSRKLLEFFVSLRDLFMQRLDDDEQTLDVLRQPFAAFSSQLRGRASSVFRCRQCESLAVACGPSREPN
jgi:hypothetical protein